MKVLILYQQKHCQFELKESWQSRQSERKQEASPNSRGKIQIRKTTQPQTHQERKHRPEGRAIIQEVGAYSHGKLSRDFDNQWSLTFWIS